jgi:hypothetical protein
MLHTLKQLLHRGRTDPAQLALPLDAPAAARNGDAFLRHLRGLGLRRIERCRLTRNRNVMVSFAGNLLRVHEGYVDAPDAVHRAIVTFVEGRTRAERRAAQRVIVSHQLPVVDVAEPRREQTRPQDQPIADELARHHERLNAEFFGGTLKRVPIRVSRRMKSRLGHYTAATPNHSAEIAIGWRHVRRHGWPEALHTLLHEMVHQWQDEQGLPIDHGARFRAKARTVGIEPMARRAVRA